MSKSLRAATIRLAASNPELRPHLLPLLASSREAGAFGDILDGLFKSYKKQHPNSKAPPQSLKDEAKERAEKAEKKDDGKANETKYKPGPGITVGPMSGTKVLKSHHHVDTSGSGKKHHSEAAATHAYRSTQLEEQLTPGFTSPKQERLKKLIKKHDDAMDAHMDAASKGDSTKANSLSKSLQEDDKE
jgi:hypothetical protein